MNDVPSVHRLLYQTLTDNHRLCWFSSPLISLACASAVRCTTSSTSGTSTRCLTCSGVEASRSWPTCSGKRESKDGTKSQVLLASLNHMLMLFFFFSSCSGSWSWVWSSFHGTLTPLLTAAPPPSTSVTSSSSSACGWLRLFPQRKRKKMHPPRTNASEPQAGQAELCIYSNQLPPSSSSLWSSQHRYRGRSLGWTV